MKKQVLLLTIILNLVIINGQCMAASGSAVIPYFLATGPVMTFLSISNISNSTVNVKLTLINQNSDIIFDDNSASTGVITVYRQGVATTPANYQEPSSNNTVTFDLPGKNTLWFHVKTSSYFDGYGVIEWSQNGTTTVHPLVANGIIQVLDTSIQRYHWNTIPINNGLPF